MCSAQTWSKVLQMQMKTQKSKAQILKTVLIISAGCDHHVLCFCLFVFEEETPSWIILWETAQVSTHIDGACALW